MSNETLTERSTVSRVLKLAGFGGLLVAAGLMSGCYAGPGYGYGYGYSYRPVYVAAPPPPPVYRCAVRRSWDPWIGAYRVRRVCY